jgi:hypothetical protein
MDKLGHLLWTIGKTAVVVAIVEVMTIALIPSVAAANVYIGGYLTNSECYDTTQVIMSCRVPPVEVADGNFLAGVLSVAGVEDGDLSGWIYQIGIARVDTGELYYSGQSWEGSTRRYFSEGFMPDAVDWAGIFIRMDMGESTDCYTNRVWGYKDDLDHLSYYHQGSVGMHSGEDHMRVGTSSYWLRTYKHFQFGVESLSPVTEYWQCRENSVAYYYDDAWRYEPAQVTYGYDSWITHTGGFFGPKSLVGGSNYGGVSLGSHPSDMVTWLYTGATVAEGSQIWSSGGSVSIDPSAPFKGGIEGCVVNSATGYPLPYSTITVEGPDPQQIQTDYYGQYHIFDLDAEATYTVTASHLAFDPEDYTFVQSHVDFRARNFALDPTGGPIPY